MPRACLGCGSLPREHRTRSLLRRVPSRRVGGGGYAGPRDVERVKRWVKTASFADIEDTRQHFQQLFDDAYLVVVREDRETLREAGAELP